MTAEGVSGRDHPMFELEAKKNRSTVATYLKTCKIDTEQHKVICCFSHYCQVNVKTNELNNRKQQLLVRQLSKSRQLLMRQLSKSL